jgi:hypothetical protein
MRPHLQRKPATFLAVARIAAETKIHVIEGEPPVTVALVRIQVLCFFLGMKMFDIIMGIQFAHLGKPTFAIG